MADSTQRSETTPVEHLAYPSPPLEINTKLDSFSLKSSATTGDIVANAANSQELTSEAENEHAVSTELSYDSLEEYRYAFALQELSSAASHPPTQGDIPSESINDMNSSQICHTPESVLVDSPLIPFKTGFPLIQHSIQEVPQASWDYRQYIATQQAPPSSNLFPLPNSSPEISYMSHYYTCVPFDSQQTPTTPVSTRRRHSMTYAGPYPQPTTNPIQDPMSPSNDKWSTKIRSSAGPLRRSPERKHACLVCRKLFLRPCSLETHKRTHTGEKPFPCPVENCSRNAEGNGFSVRSNMTRHIKSCHPGYVYPATTKGSMKSPSQESIAGKATEI
jgi:hypothetical protein